MEVTQELYTKTERKFFYGQIQGQEELGGIKSPIPNYSVKIREILQKKGIDIQPTYIRGVLWANTDNEDIWSAVVELLLVEKDKRIVALKKKAELLQN